MSKVRCNNLNFATCYLLFALCIGFFLSSFFFFLLFGSCILHICALLTNGASVVAVLART